MFLKMLVKLLLLNWQLSEHQYVFTRCKPPRVSCALVRWSISSFINKQMNSLRFTSE